MYYNLNKIKRIILKEGLYNEMSQLINSFPKTLKKSKIYFIGDFNEGYFIKKNSILENLNELMNNKTFPKKRKSLIEKENYTLQKRVKFLLSSISADKTNAFVTNLIYKTLKFEDKIDNFDYWAEKYWVIHKELLPMVDPEIILVLGNNNFEFVGSKMSNFSKFSSLHGNYKNQFSCRHLSGDIVNKKRDLIMIPDLSTLPITQNKYKPIIEWIKKYMHNEPNLQTATG